MAREPELSIKVKVDPQINPSSLKTSIERQVKQSGEKPKIEIDPNVDGIKGKIEEKLKNVKATATVTPVVDIEKIKTDIQRQINGISDMPKVTVGVDVNNFSNELSEQLKTQLKEVNQQLSYYLKNLTVNSANISVAVDNLLPARGISKAAQKELKVVREELSAGLEQTKKDLKPFNISDLFDGSSNKTITSLQDIKHSIFDLLEQAKGLEDFFDDNDKLTPEFTAEFSNFKKNAAEIIDIIKVLKTNISSKDISGILDNGFWQIGENTDSFRPLLTFLEKVIKYSGEITSSGDLYDKFFDKITNGSKRGLDALSVLSEKAGQNLDSISERSNEVIENQKAVKAELVSASKELASAINQDQSGYLDASTIEAYGNAIDRVLGNIAQKQEDINAKRQEAINLEKNILSNTVSTREGLSHELEEYTKVLNKFDTEKITKLAASLKDTSVAAEQSVPKELVQPVAQPSKKEPPKFAGGGIPDFNEGLKNNKKTEETVIPIKGKVTITDADITVDVKNPVKIPSVAVIDSSAAQIGNTDDLKVSADALASANKSLNGIASKTDRYVSNISALGPAFQYVAQEVDNLSHSLENQIIDFDRISEQTNAYIGKAGSILINTSNVAITGEPTTIDGKVILTANDIVPPEEPVDIKGHVELKVSDITPPSEPVELQGTIAKTTMQSTVKGKKKKGQDVEKPDVVELAGHVKLEDKDIERPNPVKLNGAVKIKDSDIKVGDIEISKKKFDINGNLILKNAEILDAIKGSSKSNIGKKKNSKPTESNNSDDVKAQQEANRLLLQEEQTQQRIADAAQRKAAAENKAFNSETASLQRKYDQAELDNLNRIEKKYKELTALERQRGTFTKPEKALDLMHTEAMIDKVKKELDLMLQNASETGYNPLKVSSIGDQAMEYFFAKSSADNKFNLAGEAAEQKKLKEEHDQYIKDLRLEISLEKDLREGRDKYGSDSDYVKQTEVDLKALKKKNRDYEHSVGYEFLSQDRDWIDLTSKKRNQRLQYRATSVPKKEKQQEFLSAYDEYAKQNNTSLSITDPDVLKVYEKQLEEKAEKLSDDYEELVEILSPEELDTFLEKLRKKVQISEDKIEIIKAGLESGKNDEASKQISKISKSIGDAKRSYNLNKENLDIDSLSDTQKAILDADKAISKIQTLTAGTDEYAAAVENANQKWREAELLIERDQKAQKTLISSVETIQKRFALLQQEVSQSSNDSLKTALAEIQNRAADLSRKDPNSYENYAKDLFDIKQDQYKVQAQYSIWRKGYKNLEKKSTQIAQGVEVARQIQEDGSLQGVDFKNIDELIAKLNTLPAQSDTYAETLKEIDTLWQEIKKKVDAVNESEKQAANRADTKISGIKAVNKALDQNTSLMGKVRNNNGADKDWYSQLDEKQKKLEALRAEIESSDDPVQVAKN